MRRFARLAFRVTLALAVGVGLHVLLPRTASLLEIALTVSSLIGLWHAGTVLRARWQNERERQRRGENGQLRLISAGHLEQRGKDVAVLVACLLAAGATLFVPNAQTPIGTVYQAITIGALLSIFGLTTLGAYLAERNYRAQQRYMRQRAAEHAEEGTTE